jgi:hypothetical protein
LLPYLKYIHLLYVCQCLRRFVPIQPSRLSLSKWLAYTQTLDTMALNLAPFCLVGRPSQMFLVPAQL